MADQDERSSIQDLLAAALDELGDNPAAVARFRANLLRTLPGAIAAAAERAAAPSENNGAGGSPKNMNDWILRQAGRTPTEPQQPTAPGMGANAGAGTGAQVPAKLDMNQIIRLLAGK